MSKGNISFLLTAGVSATLLSAALVLGAAGMGWLVHSPALAGALAMIMSGALIFGFGGTQISGWMAIIVIVTWFFTDELVSLFGVPKIAGSITLVVVYFIVGMSKGRSHEEQIMSGAGPMVALILGAIIGAIFWPQQAAQNVEESVISAAMISGARTFRQAVEASESWRRRDEEQAVNNE